MYKNVVPLVGDEAVEARLPDPTGYHILVAMPKAEEKTEGGIFKTDEEQYRLSQGSIFAFVLKLGPDAYQNKEKFPTGAWCETGQWIIVRSYSGTKFRYRGQEYRLINDDTVEGVINDPKGFERA